MTENFFGWFTILCFVYHQYLCNQHGHDNNSDLKCMNWYLSVSLVTYFWVTSQHSPHFWVTSQRSPHLHTLPHWYLLAMSPVEHVFRITSNTTVMTDTVCWVSWIVTSRSSKTSFFGYFVSVVFGCVHFFKTMHLLYTRSKKCLQPLTIPIYPKSHAVNCVSAFHKKRKKFRYYDRGITEVHE